MSDKELIYIEMDDIVPNAWQPRATFSDKALVELADSIRVHGVIEPILVIRAGSYYKVIAGERRYRASRLAGLTRIPAIVLKEKEEELWAIAIIENLQRQNLNPIEEAIAVRTLIEQYHLTQEEAAATLGRSRPAICNLLRILSLPDDVQNLVRGGQLSQGHARALLALPTPKQQTNMAILCVARKWSVHALTQEVQAALAKEKEAKQPKVPPKRQSLEMRNFVDDMQRVFQMPVKVKGDEHKGSLTLEYASLSELQHLYEIVEKLKQEI